MRTAKTNVSRIAITRARNHLAAIVERVHLNGEYFILEKDGVPFAGLMDADELEDYLEVRDPKTKRQFTASRRDAEAGRLRDATELVADLSKEPEGTGNRRKERRTRA